VGARLRGESVRCPGARGRALAAPAAASTAASGILSAGLTCPCPCSWPCPGTCPCPCCCGCCRCPEGVALAMGLMDPELWFGTLPGVQPRA